MYDDVHCIVESLRKNELKRNDVSGFFVNSYDKMTLIEAESAHFLKSDALRSPMGGNAAAFPTEADAQNFSTKVLGQVIGWEELLK